MIDIAPTLFDAGRVEPALTQHGRSLRPLIDSDEATRAFALSEWERLAGRVGVVLSRRTVRTKAHKLTMDMRGRDRRDV